MQIGRSRWRRVAQGGRASRSKRLRQASLACLGLVFPLAAPAGDEGLTLRITDVVRIADRHKGFNEPSGIALAQDGEGYWAVSDDTGAVFRLDDSGRIMPDLSLVIDVTGLEGIALDAHRNRLLAVREDTSEVIEISLPEGKVTRHPLSGMAGFAAIAERFGAVRTNRGLEGITVDPDQDVVLLAKQDDPRLLLRLAPDLSAVLGATELTPELGYSCAGARSSALDISDILYDAGRKALWLLSDTGNCVLLARPDNGEVLASAPLGTGPKHDRHLDHPEGLALDAGGTQLRVVTDNGRDSRLIIMDID